jgi:hypothetical protein
MEYRGKIMCGAMCMSVTYLKLDVSLYVSWKIMCSAMCMSVTYLKTTHVGKMFSYVLSILAVSSCFWLECQFVFLRRPYASMCGDDEGIYSPGIYSTDVSYDRMKIVHLLGSAGKQADKQIDLDV